MAQGVGSVEAWNFAGNFIKGERWRPIVDSGQNKRHRTVNESRHKEHNFNKRNSSHVTHNEYEPNKHRKYSRNFINTSESTPRNAMNPK